MKGIGITVVSVLFVSIIWLIGELFCILPVRHPNLFDMPITQEIYETIDNKNEFLNEII